MAVGDFKEFTRDGFDIRVVKIYDESSRPSDFECYADETITEFDNDDWTFVGVVATASIDGVELGTGALWGCEDGFATEWETEENPRGLCDAFTHTLGEHDNDYDVLGDAIAEAREKLAKLKTH